MGFSPARAMQSSFATSELATPAEVWLLDDDEHVLRYLAQTVERIGVRTRCFTREEELFGDNHSARPACVLVDWMLPEPDGIKVAARCRREWPGTAVILISSAATVSLAVEAMRQGLSGVLEKSLPAGELMREIAATLEQQSRGYFREDEAAAIQRKIASLTVRQTEILKLISSGAPNKVIAVRLELGLRTIEKDRRALFAKLGVESAAEAAAMLAIAERGASRSFVVHPRHDAEQERSNPHFQATAGRIAALATN